MKAFFNKIFGSEPEVLIETHGRVNLIGEHTDYNGGFVLPTLIPQTTKVVMARRSDRIVRGYSQNISPEEAPIEYELGKEIPSSHWGTYLQGTTKILAGAGFEFEGFDVLISSTVPIGSGLSSSAALDVGLMKSLNSCYGLNLNEVKISRLCQQVENDFVGARVGIMDPMAVSLASPGIALYLDCDQMTHELIPVPDSIEIIVINSGISHRNVGGGYNERRSQCEQSCQILGIKKLRELSARDLPEINALPEPLSRRSRHVITENQRVGQAVQALKGNDLKALGKLMYESHLSMRDDYEVSIPEIDILVELAQKEYHVIGARLTGGGFGGSIVAMAETGHASGAAQNILRNYRNRFPGRGTVLIP